MEAAGFVGGIYYWGQGVAVDYPRSMAAYKVGAEGGHVVCQWMVGSMYYGGDGVDVDYAQALPWIEKAAAHDQPDALCQLGSIYDGGKGVTPSWRRAREYYKRAIKLGRSNAVENMQTLTQSIQMVTRADESTTPPSHNARARPHARTPPLSLPSHVQTLMDKRVEIHGTSRADMNGKRGVATDFHPMDVNDPTTWRYTVKLDGGEAFKLKPANVRPEPEGAGGGAGKAKKGKGKKGRRDGGN